MKDENIKKMVKESYARIAATNGSCCSGASCCSGPGKADVISKSIGYKEEDMRAVPDGANLGLGCGNPIALASLREGETVLDMGSGAGFDCFLAAKRVGDKGKVIGVDMTPEMVKKARANAKRGNYKNVEFKLGEIESLPIADNSVDVVISNCVINLSPDKGKVFRETYRVLRQGGRLMVSDLVLRKELPDAIKDSAAAYVGCIAGAVMKEEYMKYIEAAGFKDVGIVHETPFPVDNMTHDITAKAFKDNPAGKPEEINDAANSILSIKVSAVKRSV